jgi:thiamine biosynthesis lipoprotein
MDMKAVTRRAFMRLGAVVGLGALAAPTRALADIGFGSATREGGRHKVVSTQFLMGTFVTITVVDDSKHRAEQGIGEAYAAIKRLCTVLDRHAAGTEASHLNAAGRISGAHPDMVAVVRGARDMATLTGGAFDPTVLPVVDYLREQGKAVSAGDIPRSELAEVLRLVDANALECTGRDIRFAREGMQATLDGIGKGYIVDRAAEALAGAGVGSYMVNAGGDIRVGGDKTWTVAIEDPAGQGRYPAVLNLRDCAVATSGGYEQPFDAKGTLHHVVNPATGISPVQSVSVSVVGRTVMEADALATAAFVMDAKHGVRSIESLPGRECMVLAASGAKLYSSGWARLERRSA